MTEVCFRPIEIVNDVNSRLTVNGVAKELTLGLRANILTILAELEDLIQTEYANVTVRLTTDHRVKFIKSDAGDALITLVDLDLMAMLGEEDDTQSITVPASSSITMDLVPEYCWIPTYQRASRQRFHIDHRANFGGQVAQDGRLSGISTGPDIYLRQFIWENESALKTFMGAETDTVTIGANTYYPNQRRSFEYFIQQARTVQPVSSTVPNPKGFYFIPCIENYEGDTPTWSIPDTMTSYNGPMIDWPSGTCLPIDRYQYCHLEPPGAPMPADTQAIGHNHYTCKMDCHSADLPTFVD